MIRIMFDSDNIADLPRNAPCATYADLFTDLAAFRNLRDEFPFGLLVIDRHGDPLDIADALDVETGLHKVSDAPAWLNNRRTGILYCNRSTLPALDAAVGKRPHFRWIATLDGTMHIPGFDPGKTPAAIQFASADMLGFHCDASVIWQDGFLPHPETWTRSQGLLLGLKAIAKDVENCVQIVEHHQ